MYTLIIVILVVILLGLVPWGGTGVAHPAYLGWDGYVPSGLVAVIVIVLVVLLLTGRL